jgi:hypothetical protein
MHCLEREKVIRIRNLAREIEQELIVVQCV